MNLFLELSWIKRSTVEPVQKAQVPVVAVEFGVVKVVKFRLMVPESPWPFEPAVMGLCTEHLEG